MRITVIARGVNRHNLAEKLRAVAALLTLDTVSCPDGLYCKLEGDEPPPTSSDSKGDAT